MKTYCKHIDITDEAIIKRLIAPAIKWKRTDYRRFLAAYSSRTLAEVRGLCAVRDASREAAFDAELTAIAADVASRIRARSLELDPIRRERRVDACSGKVREIGILSIMQQLMETAATGALAELYRARFEPHQYASIKGKGQVQGAKAISRFVNRENAAVVCARGHGQKRSLRCAYYRKADIRHCYQSIRPATVMEYLSRDIARNRTLLWLVGALLEMHGESLVIGSPLSKDLCNYLMSFAYREVLNCRKTRRGKSVRPAWFVLMFMDDILIMGSSEHDVKTAERHLERWLSDNLGLEIKPGNVKRLAIEHIDMMGYVIRADGSIAIRKRIFLRARRAFSRPLTPGRARRMVSYKGYFVHTNSRRIRKRLHVNEICAQAQKLISKEAIRWNTQHTDHSNRPYACRTRATAPACA